MVSVLAAAVWLNAGLATGVNDSRVATDRLFDPNRVVDIRIEVDPKDWDAIRHQGRNILTALMYPQESPFTYVKADVTIDGVLISDVGVRKKGFIGSLDETRPSLKLRFDKYVDQTPFGDLDRLTLNNNKQDASRLSQYLSYKLFNESGTVASRCNFARVTVNGHSLGIYSNVESVGPTLLERGFMDGSGPLFEGTLADLIVDRLDRLEAKTDESPHEELITLAEILASEPLDLERLDAELDIDAFLRFWAMESLISFWDGYTHNQNNFFIYRNPTNARHYFLPWGTDSAFSTFVPKPIDPIRIRSVHSQSVLANRLYRNAEVRERYRTVLTQFLATHWDERALLAEIDRVEALIKPDVLDAGKFVTALTGVRAFIKSRRRRMERELDQWPIALSNGPRTSFHTKQIGRARAMFNTSWTDESPDDPEKQGDVQIELMLDGEAVTFRRIGATVGPDDKQKGKDRDTTPVSIVLAGLRESDGTPLRLKVTMDRASFAANDGPLDVFGVLIEGGGFWFSVGAALDPLGLTFIDGTATLSTTGTEPGDDVAGRLDLNILKLTGGSSRSARWSDQ